MLQADRLLLSGCTTLDTDGGDRHMALTELDFYRLMQ